MTAGEPFPETGRLVGIDFGTKRVGVAISDEQQKFAGAIHVWSLCGDGANARFFQDLVREYLAAGFVVGLPVHMSGDEGQKAVQARAFGDWLHQLTQLPVRWFDERFTTKQAEAHLAEAKLSRKKRKARLDAIAAQIMLQSFLDAHDRTRAPGPLSR